MAKCNLIAYDPVHSFGHKSDYWKAYAYFYETYWGGPTSPFGVWFGNEYKAFRKALSSELDIDESDIKDCYFLEDENDNLFISPHFDDMQDYMIYAENFIPFEWFVLFEESERKTLFTHWGFNAIYYHTKINKCLDRINKAQSTINYAMSNKEQSLKHYEIWNFFYNLLTGLAETKLWIDSFDTNGYLIINYGEICNYIHYFTLDKEHSVNDMNIILENLISGEFEILSSRIKLFAQKWSEISELSSGRQSKNTIQ